MAARAHNRRVVDGSSLKLTLAPAVGDEDRISGRLRDERGDEHGFSSWLGLLSLLEAARVRSAGQEPDSRVHLVVAEED